MKKIKLLMTVLWVSMACVANVSIAAVSVSSKSAQKTVADSHKKNKTVKHRKMTEKDIAECTRLINKTKTAKHEDVRLLSSDNPVVAPHLTGKTVNLSVAPAPVGQIARVTKITPIVATSAKPIAKLTVPSVDKQVVKPITPAVLQVFSADIHQKIVVPNAKIQSTKPQEQSTPQSSIKLFVPNTTPINFDHLKGQSASLNTVQKTPPVNKSVTTQKKTTQVTVTPNKSKSTVKENKAKKAHS